MFRRLASTLLIAGTVSKNRLLPTTIKDVLRLETEIPVEINGWIRTIRKQKNTTFIELFDGSNIEGLQIVANNEKIQDSLQTGCSVKIIGQIVSSTGKNQLKELQASEIKVFGFAPDFPIQKKFHSTEFLRSVAHLRTRTKHYQAVMQIRSTAFKALTRVLEDLDFLQVQTPIITSSDCEGAGETFRLSQIKSKEYFHVPSFLTVSGQLHLECVAHNRAFTFNPAFRAENHNTKRHLSEFWMLECEMNWIEFDQLLNFIEFLLQETVRNVLDLSSEEIKFLDATDGNLTTKLREFANVPFKRITYTQAIEILEPNQSKFKFPVLWGESLQTEHEKYLTDSHFKSPVFVTNYPKSTKPFYMKPDQVTERQTVSCLDLLIPGIGEIVGGSMRQENYQELLRAITEHKLDPKDYQWYLDLRKFGSVPHGGFGLGFDRFVQFLTNTENIRDATFMPRSTGSILY